MAARKKKAAPSSAPLTTYIVARPIGLRDVDGTLQDREVGDEVDPAALGGGLRRLINSGYVACLVDGVPIRKSRRAMSRLRGHKAVKVTGRHRAAAEQRGAAGGGSSSTSPGGGEGEGAAGASTSKKATAKKSTAKKASKKKTSKKASSKKAASSKK